MKEVIINVWHIFLYVILVIFLTGISHHVMAQQTIGTSAVYEAFPYAKLAAPIPEARDLEIQTSSWSVSAAFPLLFSGGKFLMLNRLDYKRVDFNYRNLPDDNSDIEQAQSIEFTAFLIDSLSEKWKMVAILTPGFASDFETKLSSDDFTFQGVFGFIRQLGENLSLGFGAAYIRDFGPPLPLPFLYLDWDKTEKLNISGIIPSNLDLSYNLYPKIDLGLSFRVGGNRYHGNSNKYSDEQGNPIKNPQMEYSEGTISPIAKIHFLEWLHLNVEGGYAFYRNFEFLDGDNVKSSLDLERSGYLRATLVLGR
jgi:hypothetical protein